MAGAMHFLPNATANTWGDHERPRVNCEPKDWEGAWNWARQAQSNALTDDPSRCEDGKDWGEEDVWGGDWYYKSCREPATQEDRTSSQPQSNDLTESLSWREDGHPVTSSTSFHNRTESDQAAQQELGNSTSTSTRPSRRRRQAFGPRLWCHIFLNHRRKDFDLAPMLIGKSGKNTRHINDVTGAKIRVRGNGSGHKEIESKREAPVPLMVAVTSDGADASKFAGAVEMTTDKLKEVNREFLKFSLAKSLDPAIAMEDIWKYGEMSKEAESVLTDKGLLVIPLSTSNPAYRHAFPPPIPSGGTERPATSTSNPVAQKQKPPKEVYTYADHVLPARPGPINLSETRSLESQGRQHLCFQAAMKSHHASAHARATLDAVNEYLRLQNRGQSDSGSSGNPPFGNPPLVCAPKKARDDSDDRVVDLPELIESEVLAFLKECDIRD